MSGNTPIDLLPPDLQKAIKAAERDDGFIYGAAMLHSARGAKQCFVSVSFYPKRQWWVKPQDGDRVPLTADLWSRIEKLVL